MLLAAPLVALSLLVPRPAAAPPEDATAEQVDAAVEALLGMQEGAGHGEWPYEGVYRVANPDPKGEERYIIPIGYRVGGTSIVGSAVFLAPGYAASAERRRAVERAVAFVTSAVDDPLMDPEYESGYDVRGWGYIYALDFLLLLEREKAVPKEHEAAARRAVDYYLASLQQIEIPQSGGWNYARPSGPLTQPAATSPFMTGPALQALFAAKAQGYRVDPEVVARGLDALERGRVDSGEVIYSTMAGRTSRGGQLPGSVGRMLVTETTLHLAGRGDLSRVRGAIDAFLVHWEWLDQRRAQSGTHVAPYGVAPYYFYYAHYYCAQAIEQLPKQERAEYRRRLRQRLDAVRLEDGTWNDRVFPRTANYGTACSVMALGWPERDAPAGWEAE
ncbi:MAG: terpene cyclase/mutase family protein [Planctomycetes bacterium]|nr:terpene cyclase/mutase family protein [Planctomycetota bacterium]